MDIDKLVNIANGLNNEDVSALINMLSDRLFVFVELAENRGACLDLKEELPSCTNGARIQLNVERIEKETIKNALR